MKDDRIEYSNLNAKEIASAQRRFIRSWPWLILVVAGAGIASSWRAEGVVYDLSRSDLTAADKVVRLQAFFAASGPAAPVLYIVFVVVEVVVAPIPGIMLYAPGGMIFGPFWGGALALIGNTLGAGLACILAQRLNASRLQRWAAVDAQSPLLVAVQTRGARWIFWLRLNPLTSSDVLSYAAGLAGIPARKVMAATACGMAPLCFIQSAVSESLFRRFPTLLYPLLAVCGVYVIAALFLLRREFVRSRPKLTELPQPRISFHINSRTMATSAGESVNSSGDKHEGEGVRSRPTADS